MASRSDERDRRQAARARGASAVARRITSSLLKQLPEILGDTRGHAVFVYADALGDGRLDLPPGLRDKVFYVTKSDAEERRQEARHAHHIRVPSIALTRLGQIKVAVVSALARGWVKRGDVVVCLSGIAGSGTLDTVMVLEVGRELETFAAPLTATPEGVLPEVVERVMELAVDLGCEGREGKPVGALFVVGDTDRLRGMTRPLILNPFRGYEETERNILDPELDETVKELAVVDGAFLVRGDGVIDAAGVFLETTAEPEGELPGGLGARHHAAAGITAVSRSIAITVSESSGTVMFFRDGKVVTSIERPRPMESVE